MGSNDWLNSDVWDVTWRGEPVVTLEQLLAVAHSQFPGTDREVLLEFIKLPAFAKAPDRLAYQVMNRVGRRVSYSRDGARQEIRRMPLTKRSKSRVYGGPKSVFKHNASLLPAGVVGIGSASFYPVGDDRAKVEWVDSEESYYGHILSRVINRLDSEFPDLLELAQVKSVLFTTERGAPPYMGGSFIPAYRQIRILRNARIPNRVGDLTATPRSQGQMYYSLLHGIGHALGTGFAISNAYVKTMPAPPYDWVRSLDPAERSRWAYGVIRFNLASADQQPNKHDELFAEAFTDFLLAKTTGDKDLDRWVQTVLEGNEVLEKISQMRSRSKPVGSAGSPANWFDIEHFLLNEGPQAGEGLSPGEINRVIALYSTGRKR